MRCVRERAVVGLLLVTWRILCEWECAGGGGECAGWRRVLLRMYMWSDGCCDCSDDGFDVIG